MHLSRTPSEAAAVAAVISDITGDASRADDGEPSHPVTARRATDPLYVPVRRCRGGYALRVFRTPLGSRTAVAFTTGRRLLDCLGPGADSVRLSLPAVRALAEPLGVALVSVDPQLTAPAVTSLPEGPELLPVTPA
ncbi:MULTISPECIES: SAV_915 family protein [Streptomyces]|uniref:SAV_915 family protein n=1 Tax=Streptomyces TaxID=1883 RepID=UPI0019985684|nr:MULTISPECIES: SAV_915 family protein [Streptomyces]GHF38510.1 hypothetical protein GCM10010359_46520 [Streptomyces morookaense]